MTVEPILLGITEPRIATPLPAGESLVAEVNAVAEQYLGYSLDEWQSIFIAHVTTPGPDGMLPDLVGCLVSRQQGKTSAMKAYCLYRLLAGSRILSCAHNLMEAQKVWRDTVLPIFDKDQAGPRWAEVKRLDRSTSNSGVDLSNGGGWWVRAANDSAARGMAGIDVTWFDEARHMHDWKAWDAISPTMTTSPQPTAIITSNAGDLRSDVLNVLQARGRKAAAGIGDDPIRWLEWSAAPELDYDDWEAWRQATPTLGRRTPMKLLQNTLRTYREADKINGWRTERLCQQVGAMQSALDANAFRRLYDPDAPPPVPGDKDLWMCFTVDLNRRGAATMIGRQLPDGRSQFGVLTNWEAQPGQEVSDRDVANRIVAEYTKWRPKNIAYNSFVSAGIAHLLSRRRLPLVDYKGRKYFDSCQMLAELIRTGMLTHDGDPALAHSVSVACREEMRNGDGWFLSRRKSPGPIYCADGMAMLSHATSKRTSSRSGIVTLGSQAS